MCAERSAIFAGVASGETSFEVLAIAADGDEVPSPCGACRQVMEEFNIPWVVLANLQKRRKVVSRESLLPMAFGGDYLKEKKENDGK